MEESLKLQPAIEDVDVKIRFDKLEESMSDFDYTSLTGDMLDVKIYTKVKDVQATIRIEFIEELNYPLMYVEDINYIIAGVVIQTTPINYFLINQLKIN